MEPYQNTNLPNAGNQFGNQAGNQFGKLSFPPGRRKLDRLNVFISLERKFK